MNIPDYIYCNNNLTGHKRHSEHLNLGGCTNRINACRYAVCTVITNH